MVATEVAVATVREEEAPTLVEEPQAPALAPQVGSEVVAELLQQSLEERKKNADDATEIFPLLMRGRVHEKEDADVPRQNVFVVLEGFRSWQTAKVTSQFDFSGMVFNGWRRREQRRRRAAQTQQR